MRKHIATLTVLIGGISAALMVLFLKVDFTPKVASTQASQVDSAFRLLFAIGSFVLVLVLVILVYSIVVFRRKPGDTTDGPPIKGHNGLELFWTATPLALVIGLGVYGAILLQNVTKAAPPDQELVVNVTGMQWAWIFEYPKYGITSGELDLPVNRPVLFKLQSKDVIHSFYVPEFRIKEDVVPGLNNELRITPTSIGDYTVRCAEICGLGHSVMHAPVKVLSQADFDSWVAKQKQ